MTQEYKTLSKRAKDILRRPEGLDVEFKRNTKGVKSNSLVAFANSNSVGSILIGVDEKPSNKSLESGVICGCPITDSERLKIQNMAADCNPPIPLDIITENTNKIPFFRIEIPSGKNKPYCTKGGEYKIREDGRSRALHQDELLAIFMNKEGEKFLSQFKKSVSDLEDKVKSMNSTIKSEIDNLFSGIENTSESISFQLEDILSEANESVSNSLETESTISELFSRLSDTEHAIHRLSSHLGL